MSRLLVMLPILLIILVSLLLFLLVRVPAAAEEATDDAVPAVGVAVLFAGLKTFKSKQLLAATDHRLHTYPPSHLHTYLPTCLPTYVECLRFQ